MSKSAAEYHSMNKQPAAIAQIYNTTEHAIYRYLAYRDIPQLISKYVAGDKALDYGAGTGISTQFLISQKFQVTGVDVSNDMLKQARINCPTNEFYLLENSSIPLPATSFDLVFSSFVLFELSTPEMVVSYLKEANRVMKENGVFIGVTGSEELYSREWFCFDTDFPENKKLQSGSTAKMVLPGKDIEFTDFYWTSADYDRFFKEAGLEIVEKYFPLGKENEPFHWKDEIAFPPYVIFVAKKIQR